jgi:hypothetical protein
VLGVLVLKVQTGAGAEGAVLGVRVLELTAARALSALTAV